MGLGAGADSSSHVPFTSVEWRRAAELLGHVAVPLSLLKGLRVLPSSSHSHSARASLSRRPHQHCPPSVTHCRGECSEAQSGAETCQGRPAPRAPPLRPGGQAVGGTRSVHPFLTGPGAPHCAPPPSHRDGPPGLPPQRTSVSVCLSGSELWGGQAGGMRTLLNLKPPSF